MLFSEDLAVPASGAQIATTFRSTDFGEILIKGIRSLSWFLLENKFNSTCKDLCYFHALLFSATFEYTLISKKRAQ